MNSTPFICIAGNIGVGKTTFTKILSEKYDWEAFYESVEDNPYLEDFYSDMDRWSFNLQIYFLQHRFYHHAKISEMKSGVVQDRSIYEDVNIFAYNLHDMGYMSKRDWTTYRELFINMTCFLKKPDLIIYLKANTDTLIRRIKNRSREYERDIDIEYLHRLNIYYKRWFEQIDDFNILEIDTNNFNIFKDKKMFNKICKDIESKL